MKASLTEQISRRGEIVQTGRRARRFLKRQAARLARLAAKRAPEDAPRQRRYRGWFD